MHHAQFIHDARLLPFLFQLSLLKWHPHELANALFLPSYHYMDVLDGPFPMLPDELHHLYPTTQVIDC